MPTKPSSRPAAGAQAPDRSTRLENLRFADGRATVEIDGSAVELTSEKAAPAVQAFQSFYQEAYRAYGTAPEAAAEADARNQRAPWWQRLRGWIARWLGGAEHGASSGASSGPKADTKAWNASATVGTPPAETKGKTAEVNADTKARRASATVGSASAEKDARPEPPLLMAVFADEKGVHVLWNLTPGQGKDQLKERSYGFESPVAARLQDCYGKLSELGYDVVDLKPWQVAPEAAATPAAAAPGAKVNPEKGERVVRLLPADSDHPLRVAVAPIDGDLTPKTFQEGAKRVKALHAAADPAQPPEKRLTFLRGAIDAKGEFKVTDYATGEDPAAAKWQGIKTLWPDDSPSPKPSKAEAKAKTDPKPEAESKPSLSSTQPELNMT